VTDRLLVGLDGSRDSAHALAWAIKLARDLDAEILAVHVVPVPAYPVPQFGEGADPEIERWAEDIRTAFEEDWCAPLVAARTSTGRSRSRASRCEPSSRRRSSRTHG
jgi:nucleotide-binding universal stress UspA family protein